MDEYYIATAGNGAGDALSADCIQQWRRRVDTVVEFDAGRGAITSRAEVKVEEMQLHQLQEY